MGLPSYFCCRRLKRLKSVQTTSCRHPASIELSLLARTFGSSRRSSYGNFAFPEYLPRPRHNHPHPHPRSPRQTRSSLLCSGEVVAVKKLEFKPLFLEGKLTFFSLRLKLPNACRPPEYSSASSESAAITRG